MITEGNIHRVLNWSWILVLDFGLGFWSWILVLDFGLGFWSWICQMVELASVYGVNRCSGKR
jgi:hypothetical protein